MADQLFNDSVMQLVLQFSNPNRRDIQETDKTISHMSLGLRDLVKDALKAGMSVSELASQVQKLASTLKNVQGIDPNIAGQAQRILNRYTPERIESVGQITAMRQNLGVESSSTASLHAALEKYLRTQNDQQRLIKEKRGEFYPATGNSRVGRGLFIDLETARDPLVDRPAGYRQDPQMAAALKAQRNHVLEAAATLFSFDKQTGRIINAQEQTYHAYNDLTEELKRTKLDMGKLSREMVAGHSINPLAIAALASRADFLVGHNVRQFDQPVLAKHVPMLAQMQTLDTQRDIPWRNLGFASRRLQDLIQLHGIDPGNAHRASDDVAAAIRLISGNHPTLGGPNYMSMMLGAQGPMTSSQQISALVRENAEQMREHIIRQLGEAPRYFGQPQVRRGPAHPEENEEYARNVIYGIEGGLTARGIRGSGGTADATPQGNLGQAAISLQNRLTTVETFLRHQTIMSGPAASMEFMALLNNQSSYQEKIQQYGGSREGRRFRTEGDKRSGEGALLAAMAGFNTQMRNRELVASGDIGYPSTRGLGELSYETPEQRWAAHHARNMMASPTSGLLLPPPTGFQGTSKTPTEDAQRSRAWQAAQSSLGRDLLSLPRPIGPSPFSDAQIDDFIKQHRGTGQAPIQRAKEMTGMLGEGDPRFQELTELVYTAQENNRNVRRERRGSSRTLPGAPKPFGSERGSSGSLLSDLYGVVFPQDEVDRKLRQEKLFAARNEFTRTAPRISDLDLDSNTRPWSSAKVKGPKFGSERGGFNLEDLYNAVFGKSAAGPTRDPVSELRQLRRDDSIARLYSSANKAADTLEQYANVVAPQKRRVIEDRFNAAQEKAAAKLEQDIGKTDLRSAGQQTRLQSRIDALGLGSGRIQDTLVSRRESLRLNELMANVRLDKAEQDVKARVDSLKNSDDFNKLGKAGQAKVLEELNNRLTMPRFNAGLATYRRESFEAETPEQIAQLREQHADTLANIVGQQYKGSILAALPTPRGGYVDSAAAQAKNKARQDELAAQKAEIETEAQRRRDRINADFAKGRIASEEERDRRLGVVNQAGRNLYGRLQERAYDARGRQGRMEQRFTLEDEVAEGRGGGGGRGSGRGSGGGSLGGGARNALDFGLGLAAFAGAAASVRELAFETAQYAGRTQQLKVVTEQMAKTNFVATDSIGAYVNVMRSQTQTTQSAYSTIQRMIQAQLDVTKAPALGRTAQNLSTLTGSDPAETLDRIMLGLVTGYTRQLHMAGLQVSRLAVNRQLRGELGREPNEFEQRQGLLNAILLEGARTVGTFQQSLTTAAGQMARLNVQAQETKNTIGNQFLPVYGRAIQLVNSGLKTVQDNPTGTSRLISGGIGVSTALGALGTGAFLRWGLGTLGGVLGGPGGALLGTGAAAIGLGTYYALNQDQMKLKANTAREVLAGMDSDRSQLRDAVPVGKNASANARQQFEFEHKMFVESEKGFAESRVSIQKNLTIDLAQIYQQQVRDFDDLQDKLHATKGGQGLLGFFEGMGTAIANLVTTGNASGAGAAPGFGRFGKDKMAPPKPVDLGGGVVISTEDQLKALDTLRKQMQDALHPSARASYDQLRVAQAISAINQAQLEVDTLDRGFEPGGKEARATFRARNADNPLGLIQAELADRNAKLKQDLDAAKKVLDEEEAKGNHGLAIDQAKANYEFTKIARKKNLEDNQREANEQSAALRRKEQQQLRANEAAIDVARIRANIIPGNYASEAAASQLVRIREEERARADFRSHLNPIQRDLELDAARKQQEQDTIAREERQHNAQRQRQESVTLEGGRFAAQQATYDPRLTTQQALIKGYAAEMQAANQLSNDEERRNQQLQLTLKLRESLAEAAHREAAEVAETAISRRAGQVALQETVARISAGRGGRRTNEEQAMEAIERRRELAIGQARFAYSQRLSAGMAGDQPRLARERDEEIAKANNEFEASRLEHLKDAMETRKQEVLQVFQQQSHAAERTEVTQARGPAEEIASVENVHQIRLKYIQEEYEATLKAHGSIADAEKARRRQMVEEDLRYADQIQQMQKQKYEEARGFSGGLFEAVSHVRSEPFAVPRFFGGFLQQQGKTIFENVASPIVNNAFSSMAKSFGPQFTTDSTGRQVPTTLGRILGGTVFGQIPGDPTKALAEVTRESTNAQVDLKNAIVSLDTAIRAVGGLPSSSGGGSSAGGSLSNPLGTLGSLIPGAAPLLKTATAIMKIPQISGLFGGSAAPSTSNFGAMLSGGGDMARAVAAMDPSVRQALGVAGTPGVLASVATGLGLGGGFANNIFMQGAGGLGGGTLAAAAQPSGGGLTINVAESTSIGTGIPPDAAGGFLKNYMPGAMADYSGAAAPQASTGSSIIGGEVPIRMANSTSGNGMLIDGKMLQNGTLVEPPSGRNVVNGYVQPPSTFGQSFSRGLGAFGASIGHADLGAVITGRKEIPGSDPGTAYEHIGTAERVGGAIGAAATVVGGVEMAKSGFSHAGAKGALQGVGGILTAASVIPGPQQPFVMAGAALMGLVSSFLPDPKEVRKAQIEQWLQQNTYRAPVSLDATIAASGGGLVSEGLTGLARNTGLASFPFNVQQNRLVAQSNPSLLGYMLGTKNYTNSLFPYAQGFNYLPGRQLGPSDTMATGTYAAQSGSYGPLYANNGSYLSNRPDLAAPTAPSLSNPGYISPSAAASRPLTPAPTNITVNMPVSAMDSQDVMRRSPDIAAAVSKELRGGGGVSDLNYYINQAVFGGG